MRCHLLSTSAENRDDIPAAKRYQTMMDETRNLVLCWIRRITTRTTNEEPNIAKYEADTYLVDITRLRENFLAASAVKDGWDYKANTYILLLTLLAVALFLFGLSSTISGPLTRWIFSGGGAVITLITVIWASQLYAKPVFDLRQQSSAIEDYSQGVGLAYQSRHEEAMTSFDKALQAYPQYTNALYQRGQSAFALGENEKAIADYEAARKTGDASGNLAGELAYVYYLEGRFADAIQMNQTALKASPGELWIQFDLALSHLAAGNLDTGQSRIFQRDGNGHQTGCRCQSWRKGTPFLSLVGNDGRWQIHRMCWFPVWMILKPNLLLNIWPTLTRSGSKGPTLLPL